MFETFPGHFLYNLFLQIWLWIHVGGQEGLAVEEEDPHMLDPYPKENPPVLLSPEELQ